MSMTVNSGAESERQRSRDIIAGLVGQTEKCQQVEFETETQKIDEGNRIAAYSDSGAKGSRF